MIQEISHIVLYTTNMKNAIKFYRDVLELELVSESEYWSEIKIPGSKTYLGLHSSTVSGEKKGTTEVTFRVNDIVKADEWLKSKKVEITREKNEIAPGRWIINFNDPDGNPLSVFSLK